MDGSFPLDTARRFRAIWISDVHLGTRGCQADLLLDFLRNTESEHLYLVGDIVDGWRLRRNWYWPQAHNDIVQKVLRKARKGTRVIYIPGNHDEALRGYIGMQFGGITVVREAVHRTADGRQFLVVHGDEFDVVVSCHRWLALLGDRANGAMLSANRWFDIVRRRLGFPHWSLSAYLKRRVRSAVDLIGDFEAAVAAEAARRDVDGIICGHVHKAGMRRDRKSVV